MSVMPFKTINCLKKRWIFYLILTGSIFIFITSTVIPLQSSDIEHGSFVPLSYQLGKGYKETKHYHGERNTTYFKNRKRQFEKVKFHRKHKNISEILSINTQGQTNPTFQNKVQKQSKRFAPITTYPALNVHDITKPRLESLHLCVKTNTPKHFIICTHSKLEDKIVSESLHRDGIWEGSITNRIYKVLNQNKSITFIDIGANIGYYSLLAAATGQTVISVEPWIRHIHKLTSSIYLNMFQNNITVINNAVSHERREVKIDTTRHGNLGGARVISDDENVDVKESILVKSIVLNDLAPLINTQYVVLKLDIEGHECRALEKSEDVFNNFNVILITMEWGVMQRFRLHPGSACQEEDMKRMVNMLTRRGFMPFSNDRDTPLNPKYFKKWTVFDVYWKPINQT